jgi:transposase
VVGSAFVYWQPVLLLLEKQIRELTLELQKSAASERPRGLGALSSVVLDREICDWTRFRNRRQVSSYTGLCPGEYSSGKTRYQSCVTKHGNPRLRAVLVETAWRLVRFQPKISDREPCVAPLAEKRWMANSHKVGRTRARGSLHRLVRSSSVCATGLLHPSA